MATPEVVAEKRELAGINADYKEKFGFNDPETGYVFKAPKGLSRQLVGKGIRVNCVSPGNTYFDGGIWQNIEKNMPDLFASTLKVNPTGKFGTAEEVANGVVFISSPMASRISGTNLVIDGALTVAV